ncbi:unnamed protein product [Linum trigynum]|uniref:Uncharacterized protein n=1 Tax=Linum trigynum TaxID=586398 RepID=A0AAV2GAU0_9ROSI
MPGFFLLFSVIEFASSGSRHSDISLVEVGLEVIKDNDKAVLLDGGGLQSASPRARNLHSSSPIFRFLLMDEQYLLDIRLNLRAISEFVFLLVDYYLCDRTDVFASSTKLPHICIRRWR